MAVTAADVVFSVEEVGVSAATARTVVESSAFVESVTRVKLVGFIGVVGPIAAAESVASVGAGNVRIARVASRIPNTMTVPSRRDRIVRTARHMRPRRRVPVDGVVGSFVGTVSGIAGS